VTVVTWLFLFVLGCAEQKTRMTPYDASWIVWSAPNDIGCRISGRPVLRGDLESNVGTTDEIELKIENGPPCLVGFRTSDFTINSDRRFRENTLVLPIAVNSMIDRATAKHAIVVAQEVGFKNYTFDVAIYPFVSAADFVDWCDSDELTSWIAGTWIAIDKTGDVMAAMRFDSAEGVADWGNEVFQQH